MLGASFLVALIFSMALPRAGAQLVSSGFPIVSPEWQFLVTPAGYADLALDQRNGFVGREYLSGEWAAAVCYQGAPKSIWLQRQFFFPDWVSNSDFLTKLQDGNEVIGIGDNGDGLPNSQSVVQNDHVCIRMTYQMIDSVDGIASGYRRASQGGAGESISSSRYVFKQTYHFENVSGETVRGFKFYQMLHGLESGMSVYDDRDYGGVHGNYRYDISQRGMSYSFNQITNEIVEHDDLITMHFSRMPQSIENGYYGRKGDDVHDIGRPKTGVHDSVEQNSLNGADFFEPPEGGWVAGAACFEFGDLAPNQEIEFDVLVSVRPISTVKFAESGIRVGSPSIENGNFISPFTDTHDLFNTIPDSGFILWSIEKLEAFSPMTWMQELLPFRFSPQMPGEFTFEVPMDAMAREKYFVIAPVL